MDDHPVYKVLADEDNSEPPPPRKLWAYWIVLLINGLGAIKYLLKGVLFFVGVDNGCVYTLKFLPRVIKICISHFSSKGKVFSHF